MQSNEGRNVCLRRCDHNAKLGNVLTHMLQKEFMVDVTIYCDDGQLNAHKLVLAASSSYFRSLFLKMPNTYHYPIIVLREISIDDLKTVIDFMYYGEVSINTERYDSIMKCANFLLVEGISNSHNNIVATSQHGSSQYKMTTPSSALMQNMSAGQSTLPGNRARERAPPGRRQKSRMKSKDEIGDSEATKSLNDYHNTLGGAHVDFPQGYNNSDYSVNLDASHEQLMNGEMFQGSRLGQNSHSSSLPAQGDSLVLQRPFHEHTSALNHHDHQRIVNSLNSNCIDCSSKGQKSNRPKHPCPICFKTFTHGFTLKRHMQTHTQNRLSFYCDLCSKNYSCKDSFLRHKRSSSHRQQAEFR